MIKKICDKCGDELVMDGFGYLEVGLRLMTWWNPNGDERYMMLCGSCRGDVMRALGFQYDTGRLLSLSRREYVTDVSVYGPHGGGLGDIATGGVAGANLAGIEVGRPDAPLVGKYEETQEVAE